MRIFDWAEQELLTQLEAKGHIVGFEVGMVTSIYGGSVNWANEGTPTMSPHSPSGH
jgi:hypothetical protein